MKGPTHPESRWFFPAVALTTLGCIILFAITYRAATRARSFAAMGESARQELAQVKIAPHATAAEESTWVASGFATGYLMAPVGPLPCRACLDGLPPNDRDAARQALDAVEAGGDGEAAITTIAAINDSHPGNLLVADILATLLVRAERFPEADQVISKAFDSTSSDEQIIAAAKQTYSRLDLDDVQFSTIIHLHHALGIARLSQAGSEPPWKALKNVIGSVRELSRKRLLGTTKGQATASKLLIAAPGCPRGTNSLSSYDLYNNLIVGYVRRPDYKDTDADRRHEFLRPSKTYPGAVNQLLAAQVERAKSNGWKNESNLWALSNAEQVLDWRRPDDARLNVNMVQLLDWWKNDERCNGICTPELLARLQTVEDDLIAAAVRRHNVTADQQREFASAVTRLLAESHTDRAALANDIATIRGWLPADQAHAADDLLNAERTRAALPQFIVDPQPDTELPVEKLGHRADRWYAAALSDFTAAAAKWASGRSPSEKRQVIVASRQLLGATAAPPELAELEAQLPWTQRMAVRLTASKTWWAAASLLFAAAVWFLVIWILLQIREWRTLRTSFYNAELKYQRRTGEQPPR
jgi:hypothetical protein